MTTINKKLLKKSLNTFQKIDNNFKLNNITKELTLDDQGIVNNLFKESIPTFYEATYQLNIKVLNKELLNYYSSFLNHHDGDSGIDLLIPEDILEITPFGVGTIDFQIQCEMIELATNKYTSYTLEPRSSISNTNFIMANSRGIIDAGYRGNIKAKVRNMSEINNEINKDACLFQILSPTLQPIKVNIVNELSKTTRNTGAFGSTNKQ